MGFFDEVFRGSGSIHPMFPSVFMKEDTVIFDREYKSVPVGAVGVIIREGREYLTDIVYDVSVSGKIVSGVPESYLRLA